MRWTHLVGLALTASASGALAQGIPLAAGQRVRVTVPSRGLDKQVAQFREAVGDTLVIELAGSGTKAVASEQVVRLPPGAVTRLEAVQGRRGRLGVGLLVGAVTGTALGVVYVYGIIGRAGDENDYWPEYIPAFTAVGAVLGAGIGAAIRTDRWVDVPWRGLRVTLAPRPEALGVMVSVPF